MAPPVRIAAHVRRSAKSCQTSQRHRRGICIPINLQGRADEQIRCVMTGQLAEDAIGTQATVTAGKENIRTRRD